MAGLPASRVLEAVGDQGSRRPIRPGRAGCRVGVASLDDPGLGVAVREVDYPGAGVAREGRWSFQQAIP